MMANDLSTQGRIELDILVKNARQAISDVDEFVSTTQGIDPAVKRAVGALSNAGQAFDSSKKSTKGATAEIKDYGKQVEALNRQLDVLKKQQREITAKSLAGLNLPNALPTGRDGLGRFSAASVKNLPDADLDQLLKSYELQRESVESLARTEQTNRAKYQALIEKTVQTELEGISKVSSARSAAYSKAYAEASALDQQAASERDSKRYATIPNARRNTASPIAAAQAQAEYAAQDLKTVGSSFGDVDGKARAASQSIVSARYALYDVSTTATVAATALLGTATAVTALGISYESSFTDVERTTQASGDALERIRGQLLGLQRTIPLAFSDITDIAALGAQLGIADDELSSFTQTIAEFSAATNVDTETTAQSFGSLAELLNLTADQYENLGSAIAYVGVNSVATESEILAMTSRIAASATNAGMAADETIALAGALASLRVAPERAQGVLETYFSTLNTAIADGGAKLDAYAVTAGLASDKVAALVASDPTEFFRRFSVGLSGLDPISLTTRLDALGLSGIRAGEVFTRVSSNLDVFDQALSDSSTSFEEGTFLADVYATRVDDIASKLEILKNSLAELAATAGSALLPTIGPWLDAITEGINRLTNLLDSDVGQVFAGISIAVLAVVGAIAALAGGAALGTASLFALRTAVEGLGWAEATTGARAFASGLVGVNNGSRTAAVGVGVFKGALISTGIGAAVVLLGTLALAFSGAGQSAEDAFEAFTGGTTGLSDALKADTVAYNKAISEGNVEAASSYKILDLALDTNSDKFDDNQQIAANSAAILGIDVKGGAKDATGAIQDNSAALGENTRAWLKNQLIQSDAFKDVASNQDFTDYFSTVGADFDEVIGLAAEGGSAAVEEYFQELEAAARTSGKEFQSAFVEMINPTTGAPLQTLQTGYFGGGWGGETGKGLSDLSNGLDGLGGSVALLGLQDSLAATGDELVETGDDAEETADQFAGLSASVRTLVDYASDLGGVFDRALDLRTGTQSSLDTIADGWQRIRDASKEAADAARDYALELDGLKADRNALQYQLSVAVEYKDSLRAEQIRAELAKTNRDIASTEDDYNDAASASNKTTKGNTAAARENRATLIEMVGSYQEYITTLASSGLTQDQLSSKLKTAKQDFIDQAKEAGFAGGQVVEYAKSFDDMARAIDGVPRNITVGLDKDPAQQALNEFLASIDGSSATVSIAAETSGIEDAKELAFTAWLTRAMQSGSIGDVSTMSEDGLARLRGMFFSTVYSKGSGKTKDDGRSGGGSWREGGYTGDGNPGDEAGVVHKKEWVFDEQATRFYGVDQLAFMQAAARSGGKSSASTGNSGVTSLSAEDRRIIAQSGGVNVRIGWGTIADVSAAYNEDFSRTGGS
jgi:TP901 family phage tail tape measure protein